MNKSALMVIFTLSTMNAADKTATLLSSVQTIFVAGNNQAAEKARDYIVKGKTCFELATKADAADAVLEIESESQTKGGVFGSMGARHSVVSGTLTLKSGDLVWSKSDRFGDAPFMSGAKVAGESLVRKLVKDARCSDRKESARK
jgi:hypothetical protein